MEKYYSWESAPWDGMQQKRSYIIITISRNRIPQVAQLEKAAEKAVLFSR